MGKLIIIILIGIVIYFFFIKTKQVKEKSDGEFIQCDKCGTFVLQSEMKEKNNKLLCKDCYDNS